MKTLKLMLVAVLLMGGAAFAGDDLVAWFPAYDLLLLFPNGNYWEDLNGNGTFDWPVELTQQAVDLSFIESWWDHSVTHLASGDFSGDGVADLVVATKTYLQGSTFLFPDGDTSGGYGNRITAGALAMTVGDFEGDCKDDLVVASVDGRLLFYPDGKEWEDLDGDGVFDWPAELVAYEIDMSFARPWLIIAYLASGDLSGDGIDDLVVGASRTGPHWTSGRTYVLPDADSSQWYDIHSGIKAMTTGDFEGDGKDDLIVASQDGAKVFFYPDGYWWEDLDGDGVFDWPGEITSYQIDTSFAGAYFIVADLASGDFSGDARDDLVISASRTSPHWTKGRTYVLPDADSTLWYDGVGGGTSVEAGAGSLAVGDFEADGKEDLVVGSGWYQTTTVFPDGNWWRDLNGNGQFDWAPGCGPECASYVLASRSATAMTVLRKVLPPEKTDNDGDGVTDCAGDCDDGNAAINPAAAEVCDGVDNDCDGEVDEGLTFDADGDGHTSLDSCEGSKDDCDDNNAHAYPGHGPGDPGHVEICDGADNDCDGAVDEDIAALTSGTDVGECQVEIQECIGGQFVVTQPAIGPVAEDVCDGLDNDCDGIIGVDTVSPLIIAPADVAVNTDAGVCTASGVVLGSAIFGDNCASSVSNDALVVAPGGIYPLGTTTVTWTVTDASGNTGTDTQVITVSDITAPAVSCALVPVKVKKDKGTFTVQFSTTDNCGATATAVIDCGDGTTEPVSNGQIVKLKLKKKCKVKYEGDDDDDDDAQGMLEVKGPNPQLVVTATDASGNDATCTAAPAFAGDDDDDDDDDE